MMKFLFFKFFKKNILLTHINLEPTTLNYLFIKVLIKIKNKFIKNNLIIVYHGMNF